MPAKLRAPTLTQLTRRILLAIGGSALVFITVWLGISWESSKQAQIHRMTSLATLLAEHSNSYFRIIEIQMQQLAKDLRAIDARYHPIEALAMLREFKKQNPELGGGTIIQPDGQVVLSTALQSGATPPNLLNNPEYREDFESNLLSMGLGINRPQYGPILKKMLIQMRYVVRDDAGTPLYLIQTSVPLDQQQALWHELATNAEAVVGLLRDDGYLISRLPSDDTSAFYKEKMASGVMYATTRQNPRAGTYHGKNTEGKTVYGAYQRLPHFPLVAFVSYPVIELIDAWWDSVSTPLYVITAIFALGFGLYRLTTSRFTERMTNIRSALKNTNSIVSGQLASSGVLEIDAFGEELAQMHEKLRQSANTQERRLLSVADAGTYVIRESDSVVVAADKAFLSMLGMSEEDVVGKVWESLLCKSQIGVAEIEQARKNNVDVHQKITCFSHLDGTTRWISVSEYKDETTKHSLRHGLAIDVTERESLIVSVKNHSLRLHALWKLSASRSNESDMERIDRMLRLALDTLAMDAVLVNERVDEYSLVRYASDIYARFQAGQSYRHADTLCSLAESTSSVLYLHDLRADKRASNHPMLTHWGIHVYASIPLWSGKKIYGRIVFMRKEPLLGGFSDDDKVFIEVFASWFEQTLLQQRQRTILENLALTDSLTELPNRRAAEARFSEERARAIRNNDVFSIALCDIDRFKMINDHYGHDVGDEVLQCVSNFIRGHLREVDWIARWGGEEFVVFLHKNNERDAFTAMERLREALKNAPIITRAGDLSVTMSIGIGTFRQKENEIAAVITEADACLYDAKNAGRNKVMTSDSTHSSGIWKAGVVQSALAENRIFPMYQPIVDLNSEKVIGNEALARMIQADGRVAEAHEFINAAENLNLIHLIDSTITNKAMQRYCDAARASKQQASLLTFINASPQTLLRKDILNKALIEIQERCGAQGINIAELRPFVIEVTERQVISDFGTLAQDLRELKKLGVRVALDDFGSGFSSFLYLAELPVDYIKIEGWMVQNLLTNPRVQHLVTCMIEMADKLKISTIAECVENRETAHLLREMGAHYAQGIYFGKPQMAVIDTTAPKNTPS